MMQLGFSDIIGDQGIFIDGDWVETKDQNPDGEVRLIQLADIGDGSFLNKSSRFLTLEKAHELKCTFLEPGDILIARMPDPLGRACIFPRLDQSAVTVVDVCIIRPDRNIVNPDWLKGLINSKKFRLDIQRMVTGTTRQRVSRGNLSKLRFTIPSLPDQIKIATLLKKTEDLIQKRQEGISHLDKIVQSTFFHLFGDQGGQKFSLREIALNERGTFNNGPFGSDLLTSELTDEGVPVIYIRDIAKGRYLRKSEAFISHEKAKQLSTSGVKGGDILISKVGSPPGVAAIYPENEPNGIITQDVIRLRVNSTIALPEFICYWFNSQIGHFTLRSIFVEGTRMRFGLTELKSLEIVIPSLSKQRKFRGIIREYELIRERFIQSKIELTRLYNSISQRAFNGELNLSKVEIDHLLAQEKTKSETPNVIQTTGSTPPKKKFETPEEERAFFEQQKSEIYGFSDALAEAFGAGKKGKQKFRGKLDAHFTAAQISKVIQDHFTGFHFTAEMLQHFLNKNELATVQYTGNKERRENPKLDLVQDIPKILERVLSITDPELLQDKKTLKLEQVFYNGLKPDFELNVRTEDSTFLNDKTPEQQSGIYFIVKE